MDARPGIVAGVDDSADGFVVASLAVSEANWRSVGLRVLIPQALRGEESGTVARRVVPPLRSRFPAVDIVVEYVCGPVSDRRSRRPATPRC
ncbi:hypothetical protein ACFQX7_29550 [Luedemannella flava]